MRCSWSSCTVFASWRPVTTSSCERPRSRIIPRNRLICGELEISSQMFMTPHRLAVRVPGEVDFRVPSQELLGPKKKRCQREQLIAAVSAPAQVFVQQALYASPLEPRPGGCQRIEQYVGHPFPPEGPGPC